MKRAILGTLLCQCAAWPAFAQPAEAPSKFEAADVRVSPKARNEFPRMGPVHNGRYELKQATMVDLIHTAYGIEPEKVLGGPSWLEMTRFDIIAKVPPDSTADSQKLMLQTLLADRFKLVIHKDTKPLPAYALVVGKKPQLKQAEGSEEGACKPQEMGGGAGPEGGRFQFVMGTPDGGTTRFVLGPGGTVGYSCRNMTMEAFAAALPRLLGTSLGTHPVVDDTGLKGKWNFDLRWSVGLFGPMVQNQAEHVSIFDAIEKQLGLKLEERQVPTAVMVVDSVNENPGANPPGTADVLPVVPPPTEFEVASIKPAEPGGRGGMFRPLINGRFTANNVPLRLLVNQAFMAMGNGEQIVGLPAWADNERFDVTAKAPGDVSPNGRPEPEVLAPLLRSLLADRFKMTYHTEDRPVTAYSLVSAKPKMKKADPSSRTFCKSVQPPPPGTPPGGQVLNCQNITMAQFADRLQNMAPELTWPVADATGLEGGWDFTLTFTFNFGMAMMRGGGDAGPGSGPSAPPDPSGGLPIIEAVEKELGLKLEKQKRNVSVYVIDHIEQKPTEN